MTKEISKNDDEYIKVHFLQSTGEDTYERETMWCKKAGEYYELDNIPFIAKNIAAGDIISVEYDEDEGIYYFDEFIAYSGNSTVRVIIEDEAYRKSVRAELIEMGCETEGFPQQHLFSVNVPKEINFALIRRYLMKEYYQDKLEFTESAYLMSTVHR